jgi:uncharacterized SAM-binding protein YcdF (DUF218 family)
VGNTVVLVLGGGHTPDGAALNARTRERIRYGISLFSDVAADYLVCSGAYALGLSTPPNETEATLMAREAVNAGLPHSVVLKEERSLDTIGNIAVVAKDVFPELSPASVYLVTSDYHMKRVQMLVERIWGGRYSVRYWPAASGLSTLERVGTMLRERRLRRKTRLLLHELPIGDVDAYVTARPLRA